MSSDLGRGAHALLRIAAGLLFLQHGLQKLFGAFGGIQGSTVPLMSQLGVAGILEFAGGLFLIVGLFTRPVAGLLIAEMIAAYFIAHAPQARWPIQNQGELALLYASVFTFLAANGAGPLSVDEALPAHRAGDRRRTEVRRHVEDRRHMADRRRPVAA
jgi:putative oxidoreductase